jgi:hypothetical protein
MRPHRFRAAVLLALASACAPARMKVEPGLAAGAADWAVSGANPRAWNAPLSVGPYRTARVRDSGTLGWSFEILGIGGLAKSTRVLGFALDGPGGALDAECHERTFEAIAVGGVRYDRIGSQGKPLLGCAFRPQGGGPAHTLVLRATGRPDPAFVGELRDGAGRVTYEIASRHALQGSSLPLGTPAGYLLSRGGVAAGAIETLDVGRVLAPRDAPEEAAIAASAAALLLFRPDEAGLPE